MNIIVSGGAGYIGSITSRLLIDRGHRVVIVDNLSRGHRLAVPKAAHFVQADVSNQDLISELVEKFQIDSAIHFAAFIEVAESVRQRDLYLKNNFENAKLFVEALMRGGCHQFILSSTAAVYGDPQFLPITEDHPKNPINPYGESKAMLEDHLLELSRKTSLRFKALRYFNVAGAWPDGSIGEAHEPETHLIPNLLKSLLGTEKEFSIFGNDYSTRDGTCVRDYVHVVDLADVHLCALERLHQTDQNFFNVGSESGFSVLEVMKAAEEVTGRKVNYKIVGRRQGDPHTLIALNERAKTILGWKPRFDSLQQMIEHAWKWHQVHPKGYAS